MEDLQKEVTSSRQEQRNAELFFKEEQRQQREVD